MLLRLLLPILLHSPAAPAAPVWSGDLTLTIKGNGTIEKTLSTGVRAKVTWKVDRVATGKIVLDNSFKGGGIAGTPNTRDTLRYETWIANSRQPLMMQVSDTGTYFGPIADPRNIVRDVARYTCPARDSKGPMGQVRSSILQFDYEKGTFSFEAPRLFNRCEVGNLRTPVSGSAQWMARAPFELLSSPIDLEFEMVHKMMPLAEWRVMTGPFSRGATEVVLSRKFVFEWMHPLEGVKVPIEGDLQLVLRRSP